MDERTTRSEAEAQSQDSMVVNFFEEDSTVYNRPCRSAGANRHGPQPIDDDLRRPRPDTGIHLARSPVHFLLILPVVHVLSAPVVHLVAAFYKRTAICLVGRK